MTGFSCDTLEPPSADIRRVTCCRCCKGERLTSVLDLGDMPLANGFHAGKEGSRYPLELMVCESCWHGQLSVMVPGETMFRDYLYLSSGSRTFLGHCHQLVCAARAMVECQRPAVLDIGCNDGLLLDLFQRAGCEVLGVDPARNLKPYNERFRVPVVNAFWGTDCAARLGRKFDIITAQNVLAHVPDPADFLEGATLCLNDGGVVIIEIPYSLDLISRNEFDTIYHEHLSYFTVNSFARLVGGSPFYIDDAVKVSVHGGSLRFVLRKGSIDSSVAHDFIDDERARGLFNLATYHAFRSRVEVNRQDFREVVGRLRRRGEKLIGYGASAKGVVAMNYFDVDLDCVVDDTELKQGKYLPGKQTPIVGPEALRQERGRVTIVALAWNWLDEIKARIRSLRPGGRDQVLLYIPTVSQCF